MLPFYHLTHTIVWTLNKEVREMWEEFVECIKENWIALVASAVTAAITTVLFRLLLAMLLG